ncbi:MAG TPA: S41 family peptidase [Candidatus Paceibacterota bacterium]|jgi:carboxyl-terminal processing protease|nr:peptidase S41 [Parcubacteria group bacterium]MDP6119708.1 S41 family peptidase [Candidatus Paceibacterota bacterium]HJN62806.1 S41 family peptidase [Candidatus Paceibacterota bacterium]|tara:strand:+ start:3122 stop:4363 length:1242 start_codon:yes stop_codon:yes gene_type:complete
MLEKKLNPENLRGSGNKVLTSIIMLLLIIGAFFTGMFVGENSEESKVTEVANQDLGQPEQVDFSVFWKAWNIINEKYVDNEDIEPQDKIWGAISGLASSLGDPYTNFLPPQEAELFAENISGNFGGVGMEIGIRDSILIVIAPLKDTPAERAGIQAGDIILAVDGESTANMSVDESVSVIRGEIGTSVKLTLIREGREGTFDIDVVRDIIKIPTMESELRPDGVFVIRLFNFSAISPNEFRIALRNFINGGSNKLILDLRGNPGGFLEASIDIASWFLPVGKIIVTEDYKNNGEDLIHRSKGYDIFNENLKFVILVDRGSASASEILAGALKEHDVATIVGSKSFGKGSVQELADVTNGASLKVTVAKWLTPNGNSISDGGVKPDVEVEMTIEDFNAGLDPQLEKAVEILLEK